MSEPNQALEMLQRLKKQVDMAIRSEKRGDCNHLILKPAYPCSPKFVIGDFEIQDTSVPMIAFHGKWDFKTTKSHTDT